MADRIIEGVRCRDFAEILCELDGGSVNHKLSEKLLEIATAVEETGKEGVIKIELKVTKESDRAVVACKVEAKKPEHGNMPTLFFFNGGALSREDARQLRLRNIAPIKKVPAPDDEGGK